jgi:UDP-glucose 4-epimerase
MYSNLYKLPIVSLRYFNVYGQHQPRDGAYALVLGIFLERFSINKPLEIHGGGKQRRDFVHVSDVARCNLLAAQSSIQSGIYNVGSGKNISIRDLANLISNDQIDAPARIGDALETLADIRATTLDLDWSPKIHINEGVQLMLKEIS